ncbi:MAG: Ig-like domain repeat protein, partial [Methanobrevibacter sp.]|nr:Ig-like domain repeat protein [Methanobrevibacter sp.]
FTLEGNAVKYNAGAGLDLNIQKATVINNIFSNNNGNGISIKSSNYNATENLIDNNIISNNKGNGIEFNSGGNSQNEEYSASNNIISNNLIFNNKNGIVINKISPNRQGLEGFTGSIVENNIMTGNRIFDNIENGIIIDANKNTADDNIIFANGQSGIVNSGSNNIVTGGNILFKNSDSVTPPVTPVRQSTTVTMGNFKGVYNKIVTLSATLRSGNTPISGKLVYFYVNDKLVGEGRTNANGIATYRYRVASTGTLKVNAFFHGDSQYLGSSKLNSNLVVPKMSELHIKNTASVKSRNIKVKNTIANLGHNRGTFKLTFKLHKNLKYAKPLVSTGKVSFNSKTRVLTWTVNNLRLHNTKAATITWNLRANKKGTYNMAPTFVKNNSIKLLSNNSLSVRVLS